jgi:hypothetical protein
MKDIKELCFDFNEGNKTLIYIKKNKDNIVIPDILDIPDSYILEIIMKIKEMKNAELMNEFNKYKKILSSDDEKSISTRELMEKTLLRDYMKIYIETLREQKEEPKINGEV